MKKLIISIISVIFVSSINAETNHFPADGNVGIGTLTPQHALSVAGSISAKGPVGYLLDENKLLLPLETEIIGDVSAESGKAILRRSTASYNPVIWSGPYDMIAPGNYLVQVRLKVASNQSGAELMILDVTTSLGVTKLASKTIKDTDFRTPNEWQIFTLPVTISGGMHALEVRGLGFRTGVTDISLDYINVVAGDCRGFYSNEFTITPQGFVGILTDSPQFPLTVNGAIRAKEIIVETGWADDVFAPGYQLASLAEVNAHIVAKGHLPGLPTAKEVAEKGVSVGEMQSLLLRKIEELTLYVIKQDKEIALLKKENTELNAQLQMPHGRINE